MAEVKIFHHAQHLPVLTFPHPRSVHIGRGSLLTLVGDVVVESLFMDDQYQQQQQHLHSIEESKEDREEEESGDREEEECIYELRVEAVPGTRIIVRCRTYGLGLRLEKQAHAHTHAPTSIPCTSSTSRKTHWVRSVSSKLVRRDRRQRQEECEKEEKGEQEQYEREQEQEQEVFIYFGHDTLIPASDIEGDYDSGDNNGGQRGGNGGQEQPQSPFGHCFFDSLVGSFARWFS